MEYRARCPECGHRFGRLWYFRVVPEKRQECPACRRGVKSNSRWEWIGSAIFALPIVAALATWQFWILPGWAVVVVVVLDVLAGVILFPYCTKFDLTDE